MSQKFIKPSQYQINLWGWIAYLDPIEQEQVKRSSPRDKADYYKRIETDLKDWKKAIHARRF